MKTLCAPADFENRGGPGGPRGMVGPRGSHNGGPGGDFFPPNMNHNRFNQPTSLMQMRIPPPAAFNQRMGGPAGNGGGNGVGPMFMRNQGGGGGPGGGPGGGRQQGPGEKSGIMWSFNSRHKEDTYFLNIH